MGLRLADVVVAVRDGQLHPPTGQRSRAGLQTPDGYSARLPSGAVQNAHDDVLHGLDGPAFHPTYGIWLNCSSMFNASKMADQCSLVPWPLEMNDTASRTGATQAAWSSLLK